MPLDRAAWSRAQVRALMRVGLIELAAEMNEVPRIRLASTGGGEGKVKDGGSS